MRVIFMGTPQFALPSLQALLRSRYEVSGVFAQPDRPAGRGHRPCSPPVKRLAEESGIPVFQPEKIRLDDNRPLMSSLKPDFIVVAAYGQILPRWLLEMPSIAPVNVHPSLLPAYRGASPVPWAILNGDTVTGVTTMLMEETLDTGPILMQSTVPILPEITCGELEARLAETGAKLLIPTLEGLASGTLHPVEQDARYATSAPKITRQMAEICWEDSAIEIHKRIRAFNPWPVAVTEFRGQRLQIYRGLPVVAAEANLLQLPGNLAGLTRDGLLVECGGNTVLEIFEVQLPGRRPVSGRDFANGARVKPGERLFPSRPE